MIMVKKIALLLLSALTAACCVSSKSNTTPDGGKDDDKTAKVGEVLPAWSEGWLDIHAICTGRGECFFYIMPDGTTMVVDCGEITSGISTSTTPAGDEITIKTVDPMPNSLAKAYETVGRYVKHFLPSGSSSIDYMLMTHYHNDHMGSIIKGYPQSSAGNYSLTGIPGLYSVVPFKKMIDRSYPDYTTYSPDIVKNYANFIEYATSAKGLQVEKFEVGSKSQIAMLGDASKYPSFQIWNLCGGGYVWNGAAAIDCYGSSSLNENGASCGFLLSYGKFDWLAAGDAGDTNSKVAYLMASQIGRKIDGMKAHHHLSWKSMAARSMSILQPKLIVSENFWTHQPWPAEFETMYGAYPREKNIFFTNIAAEVAAANPGMMSKVTGYNGHVVVRVAPGGDEYSVYLLDATDYKYKVKAIYGPFKSE